jgi:hypothetical protein
MRLARHPIALASIFAVYMISYSWAENNNLPQPRVVKPGQNGGAPSDAIILFDGKDLSKWSNTKGGEATWTVKDGAMVCTPKTDSIITKEKFGDVQLHIEFATPLMPNEKGQDRGNSGVYFQGKYEVQVLDSYQSETYPDGQCASIYGEHPPLVNASLPPEQWQTYDIVFRAPKFDAEGKRTEVGYITVFHNGVLVQDHSVVGGGATRAALYKESPGEGPLMLQDHWNTVRYRNIWIRRLDERK